MPARRFSLTILTKSDLILRDLDILAGRPVRVGVTITTADPAQAALWEPQASAVPRRLDVLRQAKAAGLKTTMMFGPLLPAISDTPEALEKLFELAGQMDVDSIWTDALNPRPRVWPAIQEMLRRHRPDLLGHYRAILFDAVVRDRYEADLKKRVRQVATRAGLADRPRSALLGGIARTGVACWAFAGHLHDSHVPGGGMDPSHMPRRHARRTVACRSRPVR